MLVTTWRHLEGPMRVVVMSTAREQRELTMSAAHHASIADAVERGDADVALAILHEHMSSAMANLQPPPTPQQTGDERSPPP
ncbi:FCD domain-containing protein [Streptomyces sp. NPDC053560]|uniref:FCD domain-containing protein n=1 Tax=Streptomyces sp. NPDC053560 TaxID=3365711 RepID=UPI0037D35048